MFACRNCRAVGYRFWYRDVPDRLCGGPDRFDYVQCTACGLVQRLGPLTDPAVHYRGYRLHGRDTALYAFLRRLVVGRCYPPGGAGGGQLLDVGCGNGWYLEAMARKGWKVVGYEMERRLAAAVSARLGVPVLASEDDLAVYRDGFDMATFNSSFEHVEDPRGLLGVVTGALRSGGRLVVTAPNIESREAAFFGPWWFHLDAPRHVTFFTKSMLAALLEEHGFHDVCVADVPVPTGFAGSATYRLRGRFVPAVWYASVLPGLLFCRRVRDGIFQISAIKN